jgi:hypothetical protein
MFKGIRIVNSKLPSIVVLTILPMIIGVSAARAQSTAGTTTEAAKPLLAHDKAVAHPGTSLTLGLTGIPTIGDAGGGGVVTRFNGKIEDEHGPKKKPKKSPDK